MHWKVATRKNIVHWKLATRKNMLHWKVATGKGCYIEKWLPEEVVTLKTGYPEKKQNLLVVMYYGKESYNLWNKHSIIVRQGGKKSSSIQSFLHTMSKSWISLIIRNIPLLLFWLEISKFDPIWLKTYFICFYFSRLQLYCHTHFYTDTSFVIETFFSG